MVEFNNLNECIKNFKSPELSLSREEILLRNLIKEFGLGKSIINIFNHWINNILPKQIESRKIILDSGVIYYTNVILSKPTFKNNVQLTPYSAREYSITYSGELTAEPCFISNKDKTPIFLSNGRIKLGNIPIMLGSDGCWLSKLSDNQKVDLKESPNDPFGYFIIKGTEKVIIIQEKLRLSTNFTFFDTKGNLESRFTSPSPIGTTIVSMVLGKKTQSIKIGIHHMKKKHIPLFVLLIVLEIKNVSLFSHSLISNICQKSIKKILKYCNTNEQNQIKLSLQSSLDKLNNIPNIIVYLANKRQLNCSNLDKTYQQIREEILHDLFTQIESAEGKIENLLFMTTNTIKTSIGIREIDERDSWGNKRLETAARSMEQLFNGLWSKTLEPIFNKFTNIYKLENINEVLLEINRSINPNIISNEFESAFNANNWGMKNYYLKENITDTLKNDTAISIYSQITRVNTPSGRKGKQMSLRMIQSSQLGYICPLETPEGEICGLIKNLALLCVISMERSTKDIEEILKKDKIKKHYISNKNKTYIIRKNPSKANNISSEVKIKSTLEDSSNVNKSFKITSKITSKDDSSEVKIKPSLENSSNVNKSTLDKSFKITSKDDSSEVKIKPSLEDSSNVNKSTLDDSPKTNSFLEDTSKMKIKSPLDDLSKEQWIPFFINGEHKGFTRSKNGKHKDVLGRTKSFLEEYLIKQRRKGKLPFDCCINYNVQDDILEYYCDSARPTRPLLIVDDDGQLVIDKKNLWNKPINDLIKNGALEFIDAKEQEFIMLAMFPNDVRQRYKDKKLLENIIPTLEERFPKVKETIVEYIKNINKEQIVNEIIFKILEYYNDNLIERLNYFISIYFKILIKELSINLFKNLTFNFEQIQTIAVKITLNPLNKLNKSNQPNIDDKLSFIKLIDKFIYDNNDQLDNEINNAIILLKENLKELNNKITYTHSEIDPIEIFGIAGSLSPQVNNGQGPRATYQASMLKQALGYYHYNHAFRFDTSFKVMLNPTRPMFETSVAQISGLNTAPTGTTPICAFLVMQDNNEDAIVAKKEYIEGINLDVIKYETYKISLQTNSLFTEVFEKPKLHPNEPSDHYNAIGDDGIPKLDVYIKQGDCIVGKTRHYTDGKITNISVYANVGEEGYIDRVLVTLNNKKQKVIKVKIRQFRKYLSGDKLASRYAQKGTLSRIIPSNELPSIIGGPNDGVVPDFFINPHCIPSRMTMGLMKELLISKYILYYNERVNATAFKQLDINYYRNKLKDKNLNEYSEETMIWPDGTKINNIFVGPVYYQLLRHHVLDKIQVRGKGAIKPLTHQPIGGRSNKGGLRVGEMERDALISHGCTSLLLERLMIVSDVYKTTFCKTCGSIAISDNIDKKNICKLCGENANFGIVTFPYVFKLIMFMLMAMQINVTLKLK
jgi:DNA-directed RNA polymerase beta subunit